MDPIIPNRWVEPLLIWFCCFVQSLMRWLFAKGYRKHNNINPYFHLIITHTCTHTLICSAVCFCKKKIIIIYNNSVILYLHFKKVSRLKWCRYPLHLSVSKLTHCNKSMIYNSPINMQNKCKAQFWTTLKKSKSNLTVN